MKRTFNALSAMCLLLAAARASGQIAVPEPTPIATAYHQELPWLWLAAQVAVFALPLYLLASGRASALSARCERLVGGRWLAGAAVFAGLYALLYSLVQLPVGYLRALRLNPYFNLPLPDVLPWLLGEVSPLVQLCVVAMALGWIPIWLIRKSPNRWWVWGSGALTVMGATYLAVRPLLIDPLTVTYVPLAASAHSEWAPRVEALAARAGVADLPVVVWETRANDFCRIQNSAVGLGPTRMVVLADQIFTKWDPEQVDAAVAHELKHYLFDNTWLPVVLLAGLSLGGGCFVHFVGRAVCRRWSNRLGFDSLASAAALPLLLALAQLYMLMAIPVFNRIAQDRELEADRFALELTRDNDARARVSADRCGRLGLAESTLFQRLYQSTHPSVADRIRLANSYRPWQSGEPLVYADTISQH